MRKSKDQGSQAYLRPATVNESALFEELNIFFDGNSGSKIRTLNSVLNYFLTNEGLKQNYIDENYVSNVVFHITTVIDFIAVNSENWERLKRSHPDLTGKR